MKYLLLIFAIIYSSNSESDWKFVKDFGVKRCWSLTCADSNNCFFLVQSTFNYELFKSSNQGKDWFLQHKSDPDNQPYPPLYNADHGLSPHPDYYFMFMEDNPIINKSIDGGKTFRRIPYDTIDPKDSRIIYTSAMLDTNIGFGVSSDFYYITKDGWETFVKYPQTIYDSYYSPIFINDSTIVLLYSTSMDSLGMLFKKYKINTNEWETLYDFPKWHDNIYPHSLEQIYFVNESLGFICGQQNTGLGGQAYDLIYKTIDGGHNWILKLKVLAEPTGGLQDIAFFDSKNGVAVGQVGKIWTTKDGGETWIQNENPSEFKSVLTSEVVWAGHTPISVIWANNSGIFRYEGDFFDFTEQVWEADIWVEDCDFGRYEIHRFDTLKKKVMILNRGDAELTINKYTKINDTAFQTDLPIIDSLNPLRIGPMGSYEFTVLFKPNEMKEYTDSIGFYTNTWKTKFVSYLKGEGYDSTIGIEEWLQGKDISIHPNPASDYIEIKIDNKLSESSELSESYFIKIYNTFGQCVMQSSLPSPFGEGQGVRLDVSHLPTGIYFLRAGNHIEKFVVLR